MVREWQSKQRIALEEKGLPAIREEAFCLFVFSVNKSENTRKRAMEEAPAAHGGAGTERTAGSAPRTAPGSATATPGEPERPLPTTRGDLGTVPDIPEGSRLPLQHFGQIVRGVRMASYGWVRVLCLCVTEPPGFYGLFYQG